MRRYTALLLTAFTLLLLVAAGSTYLAGADHKNEHVPMQEILAYTTLPAEHAAVLAEEYEKLTRVRVNFVPLSKGDIITRLKAEQAETSPRHAALLVADREVLQDAAASGLLQPYISERNDAVRSNFKEEDGLWTGIWYDPVVFCVNRDYMMTIPHVPDSWNALAEDTGARIGLTDFLAADAAANLMFQMMGQYGDTATYQILRGLHPQVLQYAKYLSNPVRQAGMGEVDISIAVESEGLRYLNEGYPIQIVYPSDGTAWMLTGTGVSTIASGIEKSAAESFSDWLLSDDAQVALQSRGFYFIATNPDTLAYKSFAGKNILLFNQLVTFTPEQKHDFLDRWVKYVRLK